MWSRDRSHPQRPGLAVAMTLGGLVLAIGWSIGPARTRADIDRPRHLIVREVEPPETSLGTLHGPDRSTRVFRGRHGLRYQVLDADGTVITTIDDHPGVDSDLAALGAPSPTRGFAGVDALRLDAAIDP